MAVAPDAGPAAWGWDEDQCWTLARITDLVPTSHTEAAQHASAIRTRHDSRPRWLVTWT